MSAAVVLDLAAARWQRSGSATESILSEGVDDVFFSKVSIGGGNRRDFCSRRVRR